MAKIGVVLQRAFLLRWGHVFIPAQPVAGMSLLSSTALLRSTATLWAGRLCMLLRCRRWCFTPLGGTPQSTFLRQSRKGEQQGHRQSCRRHGFRDVLYPPHCSLPPDFAPQQLRRYKNLFVLYGFATTFC